MKKSLVRVSDHAVLRWLERAEGVDIEARRRSIGRAVDKAVALGACSVVIDGFRFIVENGVIVTVTEAHRANLRGPCNRGAGDE